MSVREPSSRPSPTQIRRTYAPYLIDVISSEGIGQDARVRAALSNRDLSRYFCVLMTRPDVAIVDSSYAMPVVLEDRFLSATRDGSLPRIHLKDECAARPGLSIVTGSFSRGGGQLQIGLSRDWDFMLLACTPAALLSWFFRTDPGQLSCADDRCNSSSYQPNCTIAWGPCATGSPPPIPSEMREAGCTLTGCTGRGALWCTVFAQFGRDRMRIGTMGRGVHATIVRSHLPGGCPPPPIPQACAYSVPSRRPRRCSPEKDERSR